MTGSTGRPLGATAPVGCLSERARRPLSEKQCPVVVRSPVWLLAIFKSAQNHLTGPYEAPGVTPRKCPRQEIFLVGQPRSGCLLFFARNRVTRKPFERPHPRSGRHQGKVPASCPAFHATVGHLGQLTSPARSGGRFCPDLWDLRPSSTVPEGRGILSAATGANSPTRPCVWRHGQTPP